MLVGRTCSMRTSARSLAVTTPTVIEAVLLPSVLSVIEQKMPSQRTA